jgi:hypothetical protein
MEFDRSARRAAGIPEPCEWISATLQTSAPPTPAAQMIPFSGGLRLTAMMTERAKAHAAAARITPRIARALFIADLALSSQAAAHVHDEAAPGCTVGAASVIGRTDARNAREQISAMRVASSANHQNFSMIRNSDARARTISARLRNAATKAP